MPPELQRSFIELWMLFCRERLCCFDHHTLKPKSRTGTRDTASPPQPQLQLSQLIAFRLKRRGIATNPRGFALTILQPARCSYRPCSLPCQTLPARRTHSPLEIHRYEVPDLWI